MAGVSPLAFKEHLAEKRWEKRRGTNEHSAYSCTACVVERAQDCRSIWEHPMVQMYDPWGLGSGQSERTPQIMQAAGGRGHRPRFGRHMAFMSKLCAI